MNKLCRWMCIAILAAMLLMMVVAAFDRGVAEKPELSVAGLLDGSWFTSYQQYYGQNFLAGDVMTDVYAKLDGFFRFGEDTPETK